MKTIDIKGKKYIEVNERLKFFRENYKDWSLESEIISLDNGTVVIKATIKDDNQIVKATGLAYEKESSSFINKTSYIENCETSAWGRALGNLGIGIDTSVASAEEVQNAMLNQDNDYDKTVKKIINKEPQRYAEEEITSDTPTCPVCGKPTSQGALDNWGCCATCRQQQKAKEGA